jgi:dephospho-CoA kinase
MAMVIGLTGQIGSGKSTAADTLAGLGATVIDADRIGREVVDNSPRLLRQLVTAFGAEILNRRGQLRRRKLAEFAFVDAESRDRLNHLVHPHLLKELRRQVKTAAKNKRVVVIDAALLLYWGMDKEVDLVLVIHAGRDIRLARLRARGISPEDAQAREKAQLPYSEFRSRADRLILNNGSPKDLKRKVTVFFRSLVLNAL